MNASQWTGAILFIGGIAAAFAALFGPDEPVGGIDVGTTGVLVFALVLGAAFWLFSVRGESVFPEDMSVAERRAWVGLVVIGFVLVILGRHVWMLWDQQIVPRAPHEFLGRHFFPKLLFPLVVWSILSHLVGRAAGEIEEDERDLRLRSRADGAGDFALSLIVVACIVVLASVPATHLDWWLEPIVLANVLLAVLIAKAFVSYIVLVYAYRFTRA